MMACVLGYIVFAAYLAYDLFYLVLVFRELWKIRTSIIASSSTNSIHITTELGVRAIFHTIFSIVGVFVYAFYQPDGILWQNVFVSGGIHFFLNWKFRYTKLITASNGSRSNFQRNVAQIQPGDPTGHNTGDL